MRNVERDAWANMIRRCHNPAAADFVRYGGRGITVCDRWLKSFENFHADMGPRPEGTSLDRENNNGNYEPGNCRWATREKQNLNRRTSYVLHGVQRSLKDITTWFGCSKQTVRNYIKRNNGDVELAWKELENFRTPERVGHYCETDTEASKRICEMGTVPSDRTSEGEGAASMQALRFDVWREGDEVSPARLFRKTMWGTKEERGLLTPQLRVFAIYFKLIGFPYARIADILKIAKSTAVKFVQPEKSVRDLVILRASGACERCREPAPHGSVHHISAEGKTEITFNLPDNLEYVCSECHGRHHALEKTSSYLRQRGKRGGSSISPTKRMASRLNARKAAQSKGRPRQSCIIG
jgi:hypothetical protein